MQPLLGNCGAAPLFHRSDTMAKSREASGAVRFLSHEGHVVRTGAFRNPFCPLRIKGFGALPLPGGRLPVVVSDTAETGRPMTELIRQNGDWPFLISTTGSGAVWQQMAGGFGKRLTTAPGGVVSGTANRLKAVDGSPALLKDFVLREKIFDFDHARSPERVVHVRGYGAHGRFTCTRSVADMARAAPFAAVAKTTDVLCDSQHWREARDRLICRMI